MGLRWIQMTEDELDGLLGDGGTGVLSFSTSSDEHPHSIPTSYGYDAESGHFHFRLAFPPDSKKTDLIDRPVSFVTHSQTDEGWQSVVVAGELKDLAERTHESAAVQERWAVSIPFVDIFEESPDDVNFRQYRLVPDKLTGRKEVDPQN